ncbi:hypothetical protein CMO92_00795 [Candidatus Woesearchaeota archaeon]|nr:hypothetical protein [Candidatus Woesearchaeota archaeon]|tara:strand:+ start:808 stop:1278 length:471 start_codon:yes stop_codon:yes gene_type:complete
MATHLVEGGPDLDELKRLYDQGKLDFLKEELDTYFALHKEEITDYCSKTGALPRNRPQTRQENTNENSGNGRRLDETVEEYIKRKGSIDFYEEIRAQIHEIEKEIWIVHERDPSVPDEQIREQWITKYAGRWRAWRVSEILYVFEQNRNHYLNMLN